MRKRASVFPLTSFFFFLSLGIFFLSNSAVSSVVSNSLGFVTLPVQRVVFSLVSPLTPNGNDNQKTYQAVVDEVRNQEDQREMQALRDQFQTTEPRSFRLLPANVVGYQGYIPGVHIPQTITLDRGSSDGVETGQAVVYQDNLVGRVGNVTAYLSEVVLLTNSTLSFTAESLTNSATGVVRGGKQAITMDNMVLSETIEIDEIVVTKGDMNVDGSGLPPNLVVGKVVSKDAKQSNLFQTAQIQSLIDITSLSTVFILQ